MSKPCAAIFAILLFQIATFSQAQPPGQTLLDEFLSRETDTKYQDAYLSEQRELESAVKALPKEDASSHALVLLSRLGRSYLGTPLLYFGRNEKKARNVIHRVGAAFSDHEFTALVLQFDLSAPRHDQTATLEQLRERIQVCHDILKIPVAEITDCTRELDEEKSRDSLTQAVNDLRASARERLKQSVLSRGLDDPFTAEQLKLVRDRLADDNELNSWAKAKIQEGLSGTEADRSDFRQVATPIQTGEHK